MEILNSDKTDLLQEVKKDIMIKDIMIKGSIQEDITIVKMYAPNTGAPQYRRQMLPNIKGEINSNSNKVIVRAFNTQLTPMDRSSRQKINKETQALNDTLDQLDLTDILIHKGHFIQKQ